MRALMPTAVSITVGLVWVFHGLYSKLLNQIPRHQQIVGRILGQKWARPATAIIGALEIGLGVWVWSGEFKVACASVQTLAILAMNTLEIRRAPDLLISASGMVLLNLAFLSVVWFWALHIV